MTEVKKKETAKDKPKKKVGRPSGYSEELAKKICDLISQGNSEAQISKMEGMPSVDTMGNWKDAHPEFLVQSARARAKSAALYRARALKMAEELSEKATDALEGNLLMGDDACYELPRQYVEAKKILIQELNREAAIRDDANYGDRKRVDLSGNVKHQVSENFDLSALSTEQLEQLDELLKNAEAT